jgi:hypothetical protein
MSLRKGCEHTHREPCTFEACGHLHKTVRLPSGSTYESIQRAPQARVGDRVKGQCVTGGTDYVGTVAAIVGPISFPDCGGYRYRLTDTGRTYAGGKPVEPIVFYQGHVMDGGEIEWMPTRYAGYSRPS